MKKSLKFAIVSILVVLAVFLIISCDGGAAENSSAAQNATKAFQIGNDYYYTLQDAINALNNKSSKNLDESNTIRLIRDITENGVIVQNISEDICIDFQGHSYFVANNGYGLSFGNSTTGKSITLKNGAIKMTSGTLTGRDAIITSSSKLFINNLELNVEGSSVDAIEAFQNVNISGSTVIRTSEDRNVIVARGNTVLVESEEVSLYGGLVLINNAFVNIGDGKLFLSKDIEKQDGCCLAAKVENVFTQNDRIDRDSNLELVDGDHKHSWDDGIITQELSENKPQIILYTCYDCGMNKEEEIFDRKVEIVLNNGHENIVIYKNGNTPETTLSMPKVSRLGYNLVGWKEYEYVNGKPVTFNNGNNYWYFSSQVAIVISSGMHNSYTRFEAVWEPIDRSAYSECPLAEEWYYKLDYGITYSFTEEGLLLISSDKYEDKKLYWQPNMNVWSSKTNPSIIIFTEYDDFVLYYNIQNDGWYYGSHSELKEMRNLCLCKDEFFHTSFVVENLNIYNSKYPEQDSSYTLYDGTLAQIFSIDIQTGSFSGKVRNGYVEYEELMLDKPIDDFSPVFGIIDGGGFINETIGLKNGTTYGPNSDSLLHLWTKEENSEIYYCPGLVFSEDKMILYSGAIEVGSIKSEGITAKTLSNGVWSDVSFINICLDPKLEINDSFDRLGGDCYSVDFPEHEEDDVLIHLYDLGPNTITIYYTIDGSDPATSSTVKKYTEPFGLFEKTAGKEYVVIKLLAINENGEPVGSSTYKIWKKGPAEGFLVYDKGYYSDGWRYIEYYPNSIGSFIFGCSKDSSGISEKFSTRDEVGTGLSNTQEIISRIGEYAYCSDEFYNNEITSEYAAKVCDELVLNGFDDWVLPSAGDVYLYKRIHVDLFDAWPSSASSSLTSTRSSYYVCFFDRGGYYSMGYWITYNENCVSPGEAKSVCPARYF